MSAENLGEVGSRLQKLIQDFGIYTVAFGVSSLLGLVSLLIFTRTFSPTAFGRYSSAAAVVAIVSTLLFGWMEQAIVRFAPEFGERELSQAVLFIIGTIAAGFLLVAAVTYAVFWNQLGSFQIFFLPVVLLILGQGLFQPLLMFFRGTLESGSVAIYKLVNTVGRLGFSLILALVVLDHIVGWLWGTAIAIVGTIAIIFLTTEELRTIPRPNVTVSRRMLGYGLPMIGFIIGEPFQTQVDRILLEFLKGSTAVGIYSSNYILVDQGLRLAYYPILSAMQPIVMNRWNGDNEREIGDIITDFSRYYLLVGVPVMVLGASLGRPLSTLLLDPGYHEGYTIIPLVAAGVFMWGLADTFQRGMELKEATLTLSIGVLLAIGSNVLLNIPLITAFGYMGAALATLLSAGVYVVFVRLVSGRYLEWELPLRTFRNIAVAGTLMAAPPAFVYLSGNYSHVTVVVGSLLGAFLYVATIYSLDELRESELDAVSEFYETVVGAVR
jgi:O-antigen/teichoic acid export membrane protein